MDDQWTSFLNRTVSSRPTKMQFKRSCRDDIVDEGPSSGQCKKDGYGLGSQHIVSGGTDAISIGGPRGILAMSKRDDGGRPMWKTKEGASVDTRKISANRPLRSTDAFGSSAISPRLRRSARIAACQDLSGIVVLSCGEGN